MFTKNFEKKNFQKKIFPKIFPKIFQKFFSKSTILGTAKVPFWGQRKVPFWGQRKYHFGASKKYHFGDSEISLALKFMLRIPFSMEIWGSGAAKKSTILGTAKVPFWGQRKVGFGYKESFHQNMVT